MSFRTTKSFLHALVGMVAIAGVSSCGNKTDAGTTSGAGSGSGAGKGGGSGDRVVPVSLAPVEQKDMPIWLEGLGTVAAFQQVTVHAQVDGLLSKVLFTEGQPVKQNQVIAEIDPRPFLVALHNAQGALARDRAQRDAFKRDYDRDIELRKENLIAQVTVDDLAGQIGQAEGAIKIDQSQIEMANLNLDYAEVKAPLDGIAGVRQVDAGNLVHATDVNGLVVITKIDPAAVFITVSQKTLSQVSSAIVGGNPKVQVFATDGVTPLAEGDQVILDNQINTTTETLRMKAIVKNDKALLWPNAFVKARLLLETRKDAIVVPAVAIQQGPKGTYVYVVDGTNTAQMKPVTVALTTGDQAVIQTGLTKGEQVVVEGQAQLRPGGRVAPTQPGQSPGAPASAGSGAGSGSGAHGGHGGHGKGGGSGSGSGGGFGGGSAAASAAP